MGWFVWVAQCLSPGPVLGSCGCLEAQPGRSPHWPEEWCAEGHQRALSLCQCPGPWWEGELRCVNGGVGDCGHGGEVLILSEPLKQLKNLSLFNIFLFKSKGILLESISDISFLAF